jgi:hypothetical protein
MHFHADEGVFLEICQGELRAWGGFWPVVFRKQTAEFFPELKSCAGQFTYGDRAFCYLNKSCLQSHHAEPVLPDAEPVLPACSIFLSQAPSPRVKLAQLSPVEVYERLASSLLFEEEEQFAGQQKAALCALSGLPAYEFNYGRDPAAAVEIIEDLLSQYEGRQPLRQSYPGAGLNR